MMHFELLLRPSNGLPELAHGLKYGSFIMRMNARSDSADELIRQSSSLLISNQTTPLINGKLLRNVGTISSIHFALSPPAGDDDISPIRMGFFFAARSG